MLLLRLRYRLQGVSEKKKRGMKLFIDTLNVTFSLNIYILGGTKMIKTNDFPGAKTRMNRLIPIVNEYDVSKAIYCICVCIYNRSVLESTLSLNWALAEHNQMMQRKN